MVMGLRAHSTGPGAQARVFSEVYKSLKVKKCLRSVLWEHEDNNHMCDKCLVCVVGIDPFPKRHRLVHNGGFPKFEALYCSVSMVNSTETL